MKSLICALLIAAAACAHAAPFEDTMAQRTQACSACHGAQGRAGPDGYYPRIAGKPAGYLYNQLLNFRDGRRHYGLMTRLLDTLSDDYLQAIAQHFASIELPYPAPSVASAPPALLARGEQLALRGDAARRLPACAQCHGAALTGVQPNTPGLLGLPRDYLGAQLGAWRTGQRQAHAPDCMAEVAKRLAPEDVQAVTAWLSSHPLPADPHPAAALPSPPPLACGSAVGTAAAAMPEQAGTHAKDATRPAPVVPAQAGIHERGPGAPGSPLPRGRQEDTVTRGAYLARAGNCMACHTARGGAPYAGGRGIDTPFGTVYAGNLTPARSGLAAWSADDFWRALHEGRSRDGRLLYPVFPYPHFTQVTRADADALFAYLRSLPPVERANTPHALRWPYSTQAALAAWRALYFRPGVHQDDPARSAEWNRGAYLVRGLGHCSACHSTRNALGASDLLDLSGGMIPMQGWYAPSLTSPAEAGVAGWDEQRIAQLLGTGAAPGARALGPMAEVVLQSTQYLTPADLRAVAVFLRSLPQDHAAPQPGPRASAALTQRGARLYGQHCADCHGEQGQGVPGAYPPLAGNRAVTLPVTANLVQMVIYGGFAPATAGHPRPFGMPPFALKLSDSEVAAVLTYVRGAWGNHASAVSELDVAQQRSTAR